MNQNQAVKQVEVIKTENPNETSLKQDAWNSRYALAAFLSAALFTVICYKLNYFDDRTNFTFQKVLFSVWACAALICGLNCGYSNPGAKRFWIFSDAVWISTAVLSLGGLLNPVEELILRGKVETSRIAAEGQHRFITNEIFLGAKSVCVTQAPTKSCQDWKTFQARVDPENVSPSTLFGRLQLELKVLPPHGAYKKHAEVISKNMTVLDRAIKDGDSARSELDNVSILWPYVNLSLLVVALGLRAGKTGADWANNPSKQEENFFRRLWKKIMPRSRNVEAQS